MLLITNKQSNILEDLDTLRLLAKIVPEYAPAYDEETVIQMAFELVSAFDEVITPSGHKENITVMQIKQNCAMESHEEKLHKMILQVRAMLACEKRTSRQLLVKNAFFSQSKIDETKANMKKKALEIDKTRAAEQSKSKSSFIPTGFGSSSSGGAKATDTYESKTVRPDPITPPKPVSSAAGKGPSKGMQLGKGKKGADILQSLAKEGEVVEIETPAKTAGGVSSAPAVSSNDPVALVIEEKLSVLLNKQGGCENVEVQGTLSLVVNNDEDALIRVAVTSPSNKSFQFKTHPNIDKAAYTNSNVLGLKDPSRPFPLKSELGILKWRMQTKDDSLVPITINCWPSISGGQTYVNIEYESTTDFDLQDVTIAIPLPGGAPSVNQVDGEWRYDSKRNALLWTLDLIDDTNRSGSMEFVVAAADPDSFYPVEVSLLVPRL